MRKTLQTRGSVGAVTVLALLALAASLVQPVTGDEGDPQLNGDVTGGFTNNIVVGWQGTRVNLTNLANGQVPVFNNGTWTSALITNNSIANDTGSIGVMTGGGINQAPDQFGFTFVPISGNQQVNHVMCVSRDHSDPNSLVHAGATPQGGGTFTINGSAGNNVVEIATSPNGYGVLKANGPNGNPNVFIGATTGQPNNGSILVTNSNGEVKGGIQVIETGQGIVGADRIAGTTASLNSAGIGAAAINTLTVQNITVTGNKIGFKIDHPQDPANRYLVHTPVESQERVNVYSGNVTTNAKGEATVRLPDYCEALNHNFRYQLTCIGQFAQAIVAKKIRNNRFTIKTDRPNVEVSWQVTGERQDAYAKANPMEVETYKQGDERGRYLHPELYGQPRQTGIHYQPPVSAPDWGAAGTRGGSGPAARYRLRQR